MTPAATFTEPLDERKFVVALARGLALLRAFKPGETMLGNRDFVERTGLPKATVNRLAYTLTVLGYLRLDEALGKYALDAGVLSLGFALLSGTDTLELARPHMRAFAREVGAAVSLGCRDGLDMIYLDTIRLETVDADELDGPRVSCRAACRRAPRAARRAEESGGQGRRGVGGRGREGDCRVRRGALLLFVSRLARRCERRRGAVSRAARRTLARAELQRTGFVDGRRSVSRESGAEIEGTCAASWRRGLARDGSQAGIKPPDHDNAH
jgi:hypothetical protein